jgi:hypothetical protein
MNLNATERKVLRALVDAWHEDECYCVLPFKSISKRTRLARAKVRLACRSLKRKGMAEFCRGCWTEDGEPAGSGYAATMVGAGMMNSEAA